MTDTTREQAIEVLAARFANSCGIEDHWDEINEDARRGYRELITPDVDALVSAGLLVLSPKDEPTDDRPYAFPTHEHEFSAVCSMCGITEAEANAGVRLAAPEPSQPTLDPEPWARLHWSEHPAHEHRSDWKQHGFEFKPRPEFSQVESQYPHRKA